MKRIGFLMLSILMIVGFTANAQRANNRGNWQNNQNRVQKSQQMSIDERVEQLSKDIELTEAQKKEVKALLEKNAEIRKERMAEMQDKRSQMNRENRETMRSEMNKEREQHQAELELIIGSEKMKKLNALQEERRNANREGRFNQQKSAKDFKLNKVERIERK